MQNRSITFPLILYLLISEQKNEFVALNEKKLGDALESGPDVLPIVVPFESDLEDGA